MMKIGNFEWPTWVPEEIRQEVARFWTDREQDWRENAKINTAPELGSMVCLRKLCEDTVCAPGRFVFAWNNIGRVVHEDGSFDYVAFESPQDDILRYLL